MVHFRGMGVHCRGLVELRKGKLVIIEYKGLADRWAGTGVVHEVRAWWNVNEDDEGAVKRAASKAVREEVGKGGSVTFESWDMSTYKTPQLDALVRVRVLTPEQVDHRKELKTRRYAECAICGTPPGELVLLEDGEEHPLCYSCRRGLQGKYQVVHWIKADGKVQIN